MHIITFYSYKGGVGRTMATVNVATELARTGARVLLVDFDLEAPSLMTFNLAGTTRPHRGIIEYVLEYLERGIAPTLEEYICESESFPETGGQLWIMPAGESGPDYPHKNFSIRWKELYEKHEGYLFIENLKAQWQEVLQPDYVLIDSRTGHNEVMGICTRQLPHAVCAVFVPNPQNLSGLKEVVAGVRIQEKNSEGATIQLHFVASNIPYEDDERGTLATALEQYKESLNARDIFAIHHYRVLALQGQAIFVLSSPKVALSKEYRALTDRLRMDNLEDRTSALRYLVQSKKGGADPDQSSAIEPNLKLISERHTDDPEVLLHLARLRLHLGSPAEAAVLLDQCIETGKAGGSAYLERAALRLEHEGSERLHSAKSDYIESLRRFKGVNDYRETRIAVRALANIGDVDWQQVSLHPGISSLPSSAKLSLTSGLDTSDEEMQATRCILKQASKESGFSPNEEAAWRTQLTLALIRLREFEDAIRLFGPDDVQTDQLGQHDAFNLAMARWGQEGSPPVPLFQRVLDVHSDERAGANYYQCLSICALVCDRLDLAERYHGLAFEFIRNVPNMEFSAWRYLRISPVNFVHDLAALGMAIEGERPIAPPSVVH